MNIIITGSSGLIGTTLKHRLSSLGYRVFALVHRDNKRSDKKDLTWSIKNDYVCFPQGINIDIIIHLAGANIGKPWTKSHQKAIMESRDAGTRLLVRETINQGIKPKMFISTSAIGLYEDPQMNPVDETGSFGNGFLSEVCQRWESALQPLRESNIPTGIIRVGLVLSTKSGLYPAAALTRKLGIVPITGSKSNIWSWIHVSDLAKIYIAMVENKIPVDIYNGVAPHPVSQIEFAQKLIESTKKAGQRLLPISFKPLVPAFLLKLVLGARSQLTLTSQNIVSPKLPNDIFEFPHIDSALNDLVNG